MAFSRGTRLVDDMSRNIIDTAKKIVDEEGAEQVNVKRILEELNITNRVFYNRFQNAEDVLQTVYESAVLDMRGFVVMAYDSSMDYYDYIVNLAVTALQKTFLLKKQFKNYMFKHDELSTGNRKWWIAQIANILDYGIQKGYLNPAVNTKEAGYAVWCFCRGFSAEGVVQNQSLEEVEHSFRLGVGYLLDGIKVKKPLQETKQTAKEQDGEAF